MPNRLIGAAFVFAIAGALGLAVVYGAGGQPQLEGVLLALALGGIGIGAIGWGKYLMPNGPFTQDREALAPTREAKQAAEASFERGTEELARRRLLIRLLGGAATALGVALLFPIRSLGPSPGRSLTRTSWTPGARLVDSDGNPVRADAIPVGGVTTVFPEGHVDDPAAQTLLIHVDDQPIVTRRGRETWSPQGYLAYSKVCTHAGCPVGLYQQATHQLLCPCHQTLFDVRRAAKPVFGPAPRALPQLPLGVDQDGFFVALNDFQEPVGPSFWNRS